MFTAHDLAVLVAVADSGSVRGAAVALGRTQPAVTQAIQRLEEAVGFALFDRSAYRVRLTERGETFVKRARASVQQARELRAFATVLSEGVEPRLRIAVHGAIAVSSWLRLVDDLPQRFPDTAIELQTGEGDAPIRRLMSGAAELAVVLAGAPERVAAGVHASRLGDVEFVNIVRSSRLGANPEADLARLPQLLVADFEDPDARFGVIEGHRYWRVSDHQMKTALIIAGAGWGSVPAALVSGALHDGTVRAIAYRGMGPSSRHPFFLCRKRDHELGPVASSICARAAQWTADR